MGGFENTATPDLYKRWTAFGMFSTHSRLHGNSSYRVPWLFDEEAVDVLRFFAKTKCALMPYLYANAVKVSATGIPMMRPVILDFEEDCTAPFLDRQYMLGDSLLVAPVFSEAGEVAYYLPKGCWTNYFSGERRRQGWHKEKWDYFGLPVMVRENTILPVGRGSRTVYEYEKGLTLEIYEPKDEAKICIYRQDGSYAGFARALRDGNEFCVYAEGLEDYEILLVNQKRAEPLENVTGEITDRGYLARPKNCSEGCRIRVDWEE